MRLFRSMIVVDVEPERKAGRTIPKSVSAGRMRAEVWFGRDDEANKSG